MLDMFNGATTFNQNLGPWYMVLDNHFISNGTLAVGDIAAQNTYLDGQNPTYSLVAGAGDADNSLFTISGDTLSIKQGNSKSTYQIRIGASGSSLFGSNNAVPVTVINDTTKPTFSSAAYTTGSGQLTITFSEQLDASKHVPTKLHVRESGSNTGGVTLSNGTITTNGTNSLTLTLSNTDRTAVAGLTTPQLDIDAGAVSDTSGNQIAAAADQAVTVNDTIRPTFSSAAYTTGSGQLAITFSEQLDASKHVPTKLHVRESGSNTGGVTLSNGTITTNGTNSLTITLSNADRATVAGLTTPQLDIDAGAVSDTAGNQIAAAADQTITINDTIKPTFSSAAYTTGSGQLAITFSEPLDSAKHVATKLHIRESGSNTGGVTLSNGTITTNGTNSLTITLSNADRTTVAGLTTPQLDIAAGAVSDTSGNAIAAAADQAITINDTIKPTFSSAAYTTGSGQLAITFSEPLDSAKHVATKLHVRESGSNTGGVTLSNGTITTNGTNSLTITLDSSDRTTVAGLTTPQLDIDAGAVSDTSGNAIAAAADQAITINDTIRPTFSSATYATGSGQLAITFSEPLDASKHVATKLHVRESGSNTGGVTLSNGTITANGTNSLTITLSNTDRTTVAGLTTPQLDIDAGAVSDTSGNAIAAAADQTITINDTIRPTFSSATYATGSGQLAITFSEPLDASKHVATKLHVRESGSNTGGVTLSNGTITANGTNSLTVTLSNSDRTTVAGLTTPQLDIDAGAVSDTYGNAIAAAADQTITINDTIKPTFSSATYKTGSGQLTITFSEPLDSSKHIPTKLHIRESGSNTGGVTLSNGTITTNGTNSLTVTLPNSDRTTVAGLTTPQLDIDAGAVSDTSGNAIAAVSDQVITVQGTDFVTTWRTTSSNEAIIIHVGGHTGTYTVNWGDGTNSTTQSGNATHAYASAGSYNVTISGDFERFLAGNSTNAAKLTALVQWGNVTWSSMYGSFEGAYNMMYKATDAPDLSRVTDMSDMFRRASSFGYSSDDNLSAWDVSSVTDMSGMFYNAFYFNGDLSNWNVSSVTDMSDMFAAYSFNGNLSKWDVSSVTDMSGMFYNADSFNGDLSNWDVSSVTDMSRMFQDTRSFNGDLSKWDVSSVTDMSRMFQDTRSFNGNLSKWDVSSVTDMSGMFRGEDAYPARTPFNGTISSWDVSSVTDMSDMFHAAEFFNGDLSKWDVSSVTDMSYMFRGAEFFNGNLSKWDVSSVTDMSGMFYNADSFNGNLSKWDVSKVTDMSRMFQDTRSFNGNLSKWDVSKVTDMSYMFNRASFNGNLSNWNVSSVTDMSYMFNRASFNGNLSNWNVSSVTNMYGMFGSASSFTGDISIWNVSSVTDMSYMFGGTIGAKNHFDGNLSAWDVSSVTRMIGMFSYASFDGDLSKWDVSSVTDMSYMFRGAEFFNGNLSKWDVSSVTDMSYMFRGASSFNGNLSKWDVSKVTDMSAMFGLASSFNGDISAWDVSSVTNMYVMFELASSFNGDISAWDVSSVLNAGYMFHNADAFSQNLGPWYVVLDNHFIRNGTLTVGDIAAQSWYFDYHRPTYSLVAGAGDADNSLFTISGDTLSIKQSSAKSTYHIRIGASGSSLFGSNNAVPVTIINDTTKPTFTSATYKTGSGELAITFSEPLDSSKHVPTKLHVRESGSNTGGVTLSNGTITANGTNSLTITLSNTDRTTVAGLTTPQLDIDAGAVSDTSGNQIAAAADQAVTINDTIRPTFSSAAYTTGSGQLTITFSEPLDASKHVPTKMHVRESGSNTGGVTLSNGTITTNGTNSLTLTLSNTDRTTVAGLTTPQLDIDAGAVSDSAGNAIAAIADQTITINDTIRPTFSSAAYTTGSGQLAITFSEPLDASKHVPTKLHIRESGSNTGGVTLSNGTITTNGTNSLTITLSNSDRTAVAGLTTPQLDIDAGAVSDTSGNAIAAAADQAITVNDTIRPTFSSAAYATGSGQLAITFSEPLDASKHVATKLHVRESGSNTGGVTLSNGTITANGTNSLTIALSNADRTAVAGLTTPQIDIDAGAVSDTSGNQIAAIADQTITINDTIKPTFSSAAYTTGSGQLTMTFSEELDSSKHVPTRLHIRASGSSTGGVTLSNGTITANGTNSLTITLSSSDRTTVAGLTTPQLDIDAGAVSDTSGNQIAAAADQAITINDTTKPTFTSATYKTGSGQLAITFSEPLDASKHVPTKLHVRESGSNSGGVTLSNGTITTNGTNSLTITLSNTDRTTVAGLTTPQLDIDAGAVSDTSGNQIAAIADQSITINDTIRPTFSSAAYTTGSGQLAITFSEPLDASKHVPTKLHVRESGSSTGGVTLSNGTITTNGTNSLTITLSNADRTAVAGLTTPQLDIDAGAVSDSAGNAIAAIADQTLTISDTTKPTFSSATYTTGSGQLAITFSEPLDASKHVPTKLHVRESGSNTGGVTLSNGTITANGTNSFTITLSNADRTAVAGLTTPQLDIDAGAVSDTSGNAIAAAADQAITVNDTIRPTFSSAAYATGSGQLAITFSEPLDASKHVPTKMHVRESGSNTGGVTLSNGTITANGTNSFTITLSNADRTAVAGLTTPQLDIDAGAVSDTSGNQIAAIADQTITINDTIKPTFSSAAYTTGSGQLTMTFSEELDSSKHVPTRLHIRASGSSTGGVTLSNGTITANGTNSLTITLSSSDRTTVAGLTTPQLDIDAGAVSDTSGNQIAAAADQAITINDTTKPTFTSATYKTGSGQLTITFSEALDSTKHVATKLHVRESGSNTGGITLSNGTITTNGTNSLTVTLSSPDRTAVAGLTTPQLDIDAGAVSDTSGNTISAAADRPVTVQSPPPQTVLPPLALLPLVIDPGDTPPANGTDAENAPLSTNGTDAGTAPPTNGTLYNATSFSVTLKEGETLAGTVVLGDLGTGVPVSVDLAALEDALPSGSLGSMTLAPARFVPNATVNIEVSSALLGDAPPPAFKPALFFDVNLAGDNFTDPSSFSEYGLPRIKFTVPTDIDIVERFADGCPVTSVYILENGQWGQIGDPRAGPNQIYVANASGESVSVVDITGNQAPRKIGVGTAPRDMALNAQTGLLYVSGSGNVTVIDTTEGRVAAAVDVGGAPVKILVDEPRNSVYAVQAGGNITVINGSTNAVERTITFSGLFSNGTAFDFENMVGYVGDLSKNAILVLDLETGAVTDQIAVDGGPAAIDLDRDGGLVYSSTYGGAVVVINATDNTVIDSVRVGGSPAGLVFNPVNSRVYVGNALSDTVSVIDAHTRTLIRNIPVGNASYGIDLIRSTNTLYVTHPGSGNVTILDGDADAVAGAVGVGIGVQAIEANPDVSNPLRTPAADAIRNGTTLECSYTGGLPHLSKFAVGGIKPTSQPATAVSGDAAAPTFDYAASGDGYNLDVNGNRFRLDSFGAADTQAFGVGEGVTVVFTVMEQGGADDLVHFEFVTNLTGPVRDYAYGDTRLGYDRGAGIQVDDPNGYFADASLTVSDGGGDLVHIAVELAFAKPMASSDVILVMWDENGNSLTASIPDMLEITE